MERTNSSFFFGWDERSVLPRFGPSGSNKSSSLSELNYNLENFGVQDASSPKAIVRNILNDRSLRFNVHVTRSLWSRRECEAILDGLHEEMRVLDKRWYTKRHSAYSTVDLPLQELPALDATVRRHLRKKLLPQVSIYGFGNTDDLYFKDLFFVKYQVDTGEGKDETMQAGLELHRDGSVLSFNVLLNPESDFCGGGTYFKHTDDVVEIMQADCVIHSGTVLHAGRDITRGKRYLLVGFVEANPSWIPGYMRNLYCHPLIQIAELEAKATAKRERESNAHQLDVEEDAIRMLCLGQD